MYEQLYADNWRLLRYTALRYAAACQRDRAVSVEDLEQAGFFGLIKAKETYTDEPGHSWVKWAIWHITREIYKALGLRDGKPTKSHTSALSLDAPLNEDDPESATGVDLLQDDSLPDIDEGTLLSDLQRCVHDAVNALKDERQREVIKACNLNGITYRDEAEIIGVSPERIRQIIKAGHRLLARDKRLSNLYDIELRTPYYHTRDVYEHSDK